MLRDAFISGANQITNEMEAVNALNIFPVPDGDTGTNMSKTLQNAKTELVRTSDSLTVGEIAKIAASAMLRGARGNSGVITSLLFKGFAKGLEGKKTAEIKDIAMALSLGVDSAYKAVMRPQEGTILTVSRITAETAKAFADCGDEKMFWENVLIGATDALNQTPELLPVLKKAGVVDSGGMGFLLIIEAMATVLSGRGNIEENENNSKNSDGAYFRDNHGFSGEITFTYCTEFIVSKENKKLVADNLKSYLETIGDCVLVVDDDEIIKVHVHTDSPDKAIGTALTYGQLHDIKIDNLREECEETGAANAKREAQEEQNEDFPYVNVDHTVKYGFVSVCSGDGITDLFKELGVNNIVSGGQTMNPSTEDILRAIHSTNADTVFVLPNNKNIIMASEQAIRLADRKVMVLQTKTIPQGLSAMLSFDESLSEDELYLAMTKAAEKVTTGTITFAARDSDFDGKAIKKDDILALENGKLSFVERDLEKAVIKLTKSIGKKAEFVNFYYGSDVDEQIATKIFNAVQEKMPKDVEMNLSFGGQPVYYFIISAE